MRVLRVFTAVMFLALLALFVVYLYLEFPSHAPKREVRKNFPGTLNNEGKGVVPGISVSAAALSPDGKWLLVGYKIESLRFNEQKNLTLWNVETGEELKALRGHQAEIVYVSFLPEKDRAVSASHDGIVKIWDLQNGKEALSFQPYLYNLFKAAISPDGKGIYTLGADKMLTDGRFDLWDLAVGKLLKSFPKCPCGAISLDISPDNKLALFHFHPSQNDDSILKIWDLQKDELKWHVERYAGWGYLAVFSPDSKSLIAEMLDGEGDNSYLALFEFATSKVLKKFEEKPWKGMRDGFFAEEGQRFFTFSADCKLKRWDVATGKEDFAFEAAREFSVGTVAFSKNGKVAFTGIGGARPSLDGLREISIKLWDLENGKLLRTLPSPPIPW